MKKLFFLNLLLIFIISFLSFFTLFSLFNYFIDPYFFFRTNHNNSYEKEIALSSDKILALVDPKNDLLEEYLKLSK